jgi:hypothetical protein
MAKIQEQMIVIKLSRLVKDSDDTSAGIANDEVVSSLEAVAQELVGDGVIVETITE